MTEQDIFIDMQTWARERTDADIRVARRKLQRILNQRIQSRKLARMRKKDPERYREACRTAGVANPDMWIGGSQGQRIYEGGLVQVDYSKSQAFPKDVLYRAVSVGLGTLTVVPVSGGQPQATRADWFFPVKATFFDGHKPDEA